MSREPWPPPVRQAGRARLPDRAARRARRGDRRGRGQAAGSPRAQPDTDFTAKLVDVHPANEDYPEGYDMLLSDSIIRCRYREGFDHEVLMEPGMPYEVTIRLPPTCNVFAAATGSGSTSRRRTSRAST